MGKRPSLHGLLNLALADGYIANWDTKHHYNRWRPITAVREAATDGNPDTKADPNWNSLVPTPAGPEYDSGHALEGGAATAIFRRFFGDDNVSFTTCSTTLAAGSTCNDPKPVTRSFNSFSRLPGRTPSHVFSLVTISAMPLTGTEHGRKLGLHTFVSTWDRSAKERTSRRWLEPFGGHTPAPKTH